MSGNTETTRSEATDNISDWINNREDYYIDAMDIVEKYTDAKTAGQHLKSAFSYIRDRKWTGRTDWAEIARITRSEDDDAKWAVQAIKNRMEKALKALKPEQLRWLMDMTKRYEDRAEITMNDLSDEDWDRVMDFRNNNLFTRELCIFARAMFGDPDTRHQRVLFRRANVIQILMAAYDGKLPAADMPPRTLYVGFDWRKEMNVSHEIPPFHHHDLFQFIWEDGQWKPAVDNKIIPESDL